MKPSMFMKIDLIEGESKDEDHDKWIDVLSWSWGATINVHLSGGGRSIGQGQVTSFDFTKYIDKASPALAHATVIGKHISEAEFHATKAGDQGQALVYVKFQFHDIIIKSYKTGGSRDSEDQPIEHVSLDYERMKYQYIEQDIMGGSLSKPEMFWDAMQGKGSIS